MIEQQRLSAASMETLFQRLKTGGWRIVAPRASGDTMSFSEVDSPRDMATGMIQTTLSPKSEVFPMWEELFRFRRTETGIEMTEPTAPIQPTVVFGVRPCDARSLAALHAVFTWDYQDGPYLQRRAKVVLVGMSCAEADQCCFCTSVGGGPGDVTGSDLLLTSIGDDYLVEIVSERGRELATLAGDLLGAVGDVDKAAHLADVPVRFDVDQLAKRLPRAFEQDDLWIEQSLRCLGCGACAYVCPT
ncbi:MAG: hydrogenase subunit beta, partial [Candidatus Eisenbacteria bacterium]|nr:hydrogenase subunit beta [Candidatus Eisenbacteria bacterium]